MYAEAARYHLWPPVVDQMEAWQVAAALGHGVRKRAVEGADGKLVDPDTGLPWHLARRLVDAEGAPVAAAAGGIGDRLEGRTRATRAAQPLLGVPGERTVAPTADEVKARHAREIMARVEAAARGEQPGT